MHSSNTTNQNHMAAKTHQPKTVCSGLLSGAETFSPSTFQLIKLVDGSPDQDCCPF